CAEGALCACPAAFGARTADRVGPAEARFDGIATPPAGRAQVERPAAEEAPSTRVKEREGSFDGPARSPSPKTAAALPASSSACFSDPPGEQAFPEEGNAQAAAPVACRERLDAGAPQRGPRSKRLQLHRRRTLRNAVRPGHSQAAACLR